MTQAAPCCDPRSLLLQTVVDQDLPSPPTFAPLTIVGAAVQTMPCVGSPAARRALLALLLACARSDSECRSEMSATSAFECDGQGPACYFREDGSRCWPTADELLLRPSAARAADIAALGVER